MKDCKLHKGKMCSYRKDGCHGSADWCLYAVDSNQVIQHLQNACITVCPARVSDVLNISNCTKYYYDNFSCPDGFLLGYRTPERVKVDLQNYFVIKENGKYAGHIQLSFGLPPEFEELDFYGAARKEDILQQKEKVIYVEHIAVSPSYQRIGMGSKLFRFVSKVFPEYSFMSSVVVKPYDNQHSLHCHKRNDFEDVAYYNNDVVEDKRYERIYLFKESEAGRV